MHVILVTAEITVGVLIGGSAFCLTEKLVLNVGDRLRGRWATWRLNRRWKKMYEQRDELAVEGRANVGGTEQ